ncbi:hypothetical protein [Nesterenkonia alkaliphila]|uniref:Amidohydrolase family protein n=1 Tax=Nesterenkonia alkaliphila TaxID=1463631 RepID=A0A7K1UMW3_9MICC|nr:hypothetical protein [Nesterenkonia alkaliphila]MVT27361.1 hypothetical protein [Nesterenkonia alkaliphila]GFZ80594.1 hypothetical protein GCM10011359_06280 [Nesterenkonia alkaliphila]
MTLMLSNGTIHSTAEPYAEAMLVEQGQVTWLGSDETAARLAGEGVRSQDLDRGLVAPGFVGLVGLTVQQADPGTVSEVLNVAVRGLGYTALRLRLDLQLADLVPSRADALRKALQAAAERPADVWPVLALHGLAADGGAPSISPVNELLDLAEFLDSDETAEAACLRRTAVSLDLPEVLPNLLGVRSWCSEAGRQLLLNCSAADPGVAVEAMVTTTKHLRELKQAPHPGTPTVLVGFDSAERSHWEQLLNTGAHVLLTGPGHLGTALSVGVPTAAAPAEGENPWQLISRHVHHSADPVSVRAGFNAQTRGAYRSLPQAAPSAGQLNPGAEATFAVWEVESLAVQTPNSTVSAWSTDTRARTPLLPFLEADQATESLPRLVSTVIRGG